jgi:1-acyl-sn-glycerol-3-phosphate acyltransferase
LYAALGATCLPIALNSGVYWPRRALAHRPGTIRMQILPAIPPGLPAEVFAERLKTDIEAAMKGLLEETGAHSS